MPDLLPVRQHEHDQLYFVLHLRAHERLNELSVVLLSERIDLLLPLDLQYILVWIAVLLFLPNSPASRRLRRSLAVLGLVSSQHLHPERLHQPVQLFLRPSVWNPDHEPGLPGCLQLLGLRFS